MSERYERLLEQTLNDLNSGVKGMREDITTMMLQINDLAGEVKVNTSWRKKNDPVIQKLLSKQGRCVTVSNISAKTIWLLASAVLAALGILAALLGADLSWIE